MRFIVKKVNTIIGVRFKVVDTLIGESDYSILYMFKGEADMKAARLNLLCSEDY